MMKKTVDPPLFYDILRGLKALCDSHVGWNKRVDRTFFHLFWQNNMNGGLFLIYLGENTYVL
jgi:hypothetical protein